ncbi:transglutaminaseTgpA domain-containing protein [Ornithinimicrobium cerasi]|uniref:transglutaminase family protein n=1 Tax=Ornithinimicrobium cerasi TaxID=2248773 RepID=UPI00137A4DE9|nr:DUF3488 and transglutaminase-like domain-containing protein [Ornithinimicrobium cerasi]
MSRLDDTAFQRGMWPEGLVAALATLAVAWPLTELLREDDWLLPGVLLVALVAVTGAVLRTVDAPPSLVSVGQLLVGLGGLAGTYLRDTLWRGVVPTSETLEEVGELLRQAGTVLQTYAAPAPTTQGVSFLVVAVLTLTAVSVDSMGVTGRAPASAGIPLAAGFLVSVSNSGAAMEPWYFAAIAGLWLVMLAQQGRRVTDAWPSDQRRESRGGDDVTSGSPRHRGLAQVLGSLALVASVVGAAALPHLPPTFLGDGLARNPEARTTDGGGGQVSFTETMDPSQDLRSQSRTPVLSYRTDATNLQPLRVTATERWDDGRWVAPRRGTGNLQPPNAPLPGPEEIADGVPLQPQRLQVTGNRLPPPHLATPSPLESVSLTGGASYRFDPTDSTLVLQSASPSYEATYLVVPGGAELPPGVGDVPADPGAFDEEVLEVDPVSADVVAALAEQVVGGEDNTLAAAVAIQNHFRRAPYRYSLELAPSAQADASDPIGGFLATQQGYCVQYATAMVMMARSEGIPARMAVGFLPGNVQPDGTRQVVAADAHTWPELWIDGMGWTRFEPTPGIRSNQPPAYARNPVENDQGAQTTTVTQTVTPSAEPTPTAPPADPTFLDRLRELLPLLAQVLGAVLVLALIMLVVPLVGRRYREEGVRRAASAEEQVEGQWTLLVRSLQDLGVDEPPERSPRDMRRHYTSETILNRQGEDAMGRITTTLERSRYAPAATVRETDASRMGEDVRSVVDQVRHASPWNMRANAALLPRSGLDGLRAWVGGLFRR